MAEVINHVELRFQSGTSNKTYHIRIYKQNNTLYEVEAQWGRIGSTLQSQVKSITDNYDDCQTVFNRLQREKEAKGYQVYQGLDVQVPPPAPAPRDLPDPSLIQLPEEILPTPPAPVLKRRILWDNPDPLPPKPWQPGPSPLDGLHPEERQTPPDVVPSRIPQLLNMIDEQTALGFLGIENWGMQEKMDGVHIIVDTTGNGQVKFYNKKGQRKTLDQEFTNKMQAYCDNLNFYVILDGELVGSTFYAFDILQKGNNDLTGYPYFTRYNELRTLPGYGIRIVPLHTGTDKQTVYDQFKAEGREGVVFKRLSARYVSGRPSSGGDMLKYKFYNTASCRVAYRSTGKHSVGLILWSPETHNWVDVGNVTIPTKTPLPAPGSIIEVRYLYAYRKGSLYQPNYLGTRDDVLQLECTTTQLKYKREEA